ncbi:PqqD family peptide modification chaperone [Streptomyces monticola]|uniref:PqqD family peptide modification chaperone n=1 Tax=Streptomyces monticola TaxID=2666263 RepID=A0ABW2JSX9_9ACTN
MHDLRPAPWVRATITDRGGMLLDLRGRGTWNLLNPTGALWWQHLTDCGDSAKAADAVAERYEADPERVRGDMQVLASELLGRGFLVAAPSRKRRWRR